MRTLLVAALAALSWVGAAGAAHADPDLRPIPSRIAHGVVSVRNTGDAASTPTLVTVECNVVGRRGGCPEIRPRQAAPFMNPAYPNRLTINVPAIAPGHVFNFNLPFWGGLVFPSGSYNFNFVVDPANIVAESDEANNTGAFVYVVP